MTTQILPCELALARQRGINKKKTHLPGFGEWMEFAIEAKEWSKEGLD
jgi:hypothetical protein